MAKVSAGDIEKWYDVLRSNGKVYQIVWNSIHVKPGKGAAFVRTKLKDVINGGVVETTFQPI